MGLEAGEGRAVMIVALISSPRPTARVLPWGVGVTDYGDRPASLQEAPQEIARVPPPSAARDAPDTFDDHPHPESTDAPSGPMASI
jgi:hypothetical protein